jgi:hypothetical protein
LTIPFVFWTITSPAVIFGGFGSADSSFSNDRRPATRLGRGARPRLGQRRNP